MMFLFNETHSSGTVRDLHPIPFSSTGLANGSRRNKTNAKVGKESETKAKKPTVFITLPQEPKNIRKMKNNLLSEHLTYNGDNSTHTHVHLLNYSSDHFSETICDNFEEIMSQATTENKLWIRVHGLKDTEYIKNICTYFQINFLMMQDILNVDHPSKIEKNGDFNFVVTRIFHENSETSVRLVQGKNVVLTFTEGEASFFDDAVKALQENVLKIRTRSSDYLFSVLFNELVSNYVSLAIETGDQLDDLETELLAATTSYNIRMQLQMLRKRYMEIKRTVVPLKDQYSKILHPDSDLINEANRPFFNDVNDHLLNAVQLTEGCRETLSSLMDLYISNSDMHMNYIMKRLTIVSTIFIPLTFLVGVWGMNFKFMPELDWKYGYLMAWGVMLAAGLASYLILRSRKWQ